MNDNTKAPQFDDADHGHEAIVAEPVPQLAPSAEDAYWAMVHGNQAFARPDLRFDDYLPAYRTGYLGATRYARLRRSFDDVEPSLAAEYARTKGNSALVWEQARLPARAAWDRIAGKSPHAPL